MNAEGPIRQPHCLQKAGTTSQLQIKTRKLIINQIASFFTFFDRFSGVNSMVLSQGWNGQLSSQLLVCGNLE
jgi:hypothetical protein